MMPKDRARRIIRDISWYPTSQNALKTKFGQAPVQTAWGRREVASIY
jgi:hypothetical protein